MQVLSHPVEKERRGRSREAFRLRSARRENVHWSRWYATGSYISSTIWIAPVLAFIVEQLTFRIAYHNQWDFGWLPGFVFDREGTIAAADYVIASSTAFIVFTFSSMLVAIQVASGQLTARIIATTLLPNGPIRVSVAVFIYTLLLGVGVKARVDTTPQFLKSLMGVLALVNILVFMFLIDYASRLLRPISVVRRVARRGLKVIDDVYPRLIVGVPAPRGTVSELGLPDRTIPHHGGSSILIAVNLKGLIAVARRANCTIEIVPHVGDCVAEGEPLYRLRGDAAAQIDDRVLRGQAAYGPERTIEQDSTFAFRIVVDIALKALSKAINDPTTAVLAIDQLERLLRTVGQRYLHDERIFDEDGRLTLIFRTPNWDDFVKLSFTEIRHCGAENMQVARRLRAMIQNVMANVPETRWPALRHELALLDAAVERVHWFPEDVALAGVADTQGLGGPARSLNAQ
jgi:uncharacterized membrane protein